MSVLKPIVRLNHFLYQELCIKFAMEIINKFLNLKKMKNFKLLVIVIMFAFIGSSIKAQIPQLWGFTSTGWLNGAENNGACFKINGDGSGFQQEIGRAHV